MFPRHSWCCAACYGEHPYTHKHFWLARQWPHDLIFVGLCMKYFSSAYAITEGPSDISFCIFVIFHPFLFCLRFMLQWPGVRILRRNELDAFLAQALSPKLYEPDQLQDLKVICMEIVGWGVSGEKKKSQRPMWLNIQIFIGIIPLKMRILSLCIYSHAVLYSYDTIP